ncbi:hypothetical protein ACFQ1I_21440 [Kitasatospora arboriphila]
MRSRSSCQTCCGRPRAAARRSSSRTSRSGRSWCWVTRYRQGLATRTVFGRVPALRRVTQSCSSDGSRVGSPTAQATRCAVVQPTSSASSTDSGVA